MQTHPTAGQLEMQTLKGTIKKRHTHTYTHTRYEGGRKGGLGGRKSHSPHNTVYYAKCFLFMNAFNPRCYNDNR